MPACESNICCFRYPTRGGSLTLFPSTYFSDIQAPQLVEDISSSYDVLVDLFDSIKIFLKRVDIYTRIPPSPIMTEIVVKIMAELLSAIALATKNIMQGRLSKPDFVDLPLALT